MSDDQSKMFEDVEVAVCDVHIPGILQRSETDDERVATLAQSIRDVGLINRVIVKERDGKYELVAGYRRFLAFELLGRDRIPARLIAGSSELDDAITFDENYEREEINPVDEAFWMIRMRQKYGLTVEGLAERLHKSVGFVSGRLSIVEWPEMVLGALRSGEISLANARELAKCENDIELDRLLKLVIDNGASASVVRYWVSSANAAGSSGIVGSAEDDGTIADSAEYVPPVLFCDLCEAPTTYMVSKFVRVCARCWEVSKANLRPSRES
jgi:ParB family chromosome partitioning protein